MSPSELALQTRRRANLSHLIQCLHDDGIHSTALKAEILAKTTSPSLMGLLKGGAISDALAREMEWAVNRPIGWLDRRPETALDD